MRPINPIPPIAPLLPILLALALTLAPVRAQNRALVEKSNGDILIPSITEQLLWNDIPARLGILAGSGRHGLHVRSTTETGGAAIIGESQSGASAGKFLQTASTLNPSPVVWIQRKDDTESTSSIVVIRANTDNATQKILDIQNSSNATVFAVKADGTIFPSGGGGGGLNLTHNGMTYTLTLGTGTTPVLTLVPVP